MGEYIYTLVAGALFVAVICGLSPDREGEGFGKYLAFAGALCMALIMLSPIAELVSDENYEELPEVIWDRDAQKVNGAGYYADCAGLALSKIYGVEAGDIKAYVEWDFNEGKALCAELHVKEGTYFDTKEAGEILSDIFGFKVTVYGEGQH